MNTSVIILALLIVLIVLCLITLIIAITSKPKDINKIALIDQKIDMTSKRTNEDLNAISENMRLLTEKNYEQMININKSLSENTEKQTNTIATAIDKMSQNNEKKLNEMRQTVDEKLSETLNQRLNESFKTVSEQLSNVYKSLGEMKELSAGVTDNVKGLNRVLTNVKARGTWAEVQLGNILDETIPGMYDTNVKTNPNYNGQVEFAVKIPSASSDDITYLPIDSKFPMEDYVRISQASDDGDLEALANARKALVQRVREEANLVKRYVNVPDTTPFAILYLATEGLYAEIASSKSGVLEQLQSDGILIAGPATITALLNSLSMGFRTMAINKKANEVWKVLGAAKTQYDKFGDLLLKAKRKVDEASKALDDAEHRNSIIQKNLKNVEVLEMNDANRILDLDD